MQALDQDSLQALVQSICSTGAWEPKATAKKASEITMQYRTWYSFPLYAFHPSSTAITIPDVSFQ
jgi:hypothetical protein